MKVIMNNLCGDDEIIFEIDTQDPHSNSTHYISEKLKEHLEKKLMVPLIEYNNIHQLVSPFTFEEFYDIMCERRKLDEYKDNPIFNDLSKYLNVKYDIHNNYKISYNINLINDKRAKNLIEKLKVFELNSDYVMIVIRIPVQLNYKLLIILEEFDEPLHFTYVAINRYIY